MTDDLSHLDDLVERDAPARVRGLVDKAALVDAREWNRAVTVLLERLVERVAAVEDGILDLTKQIDTAEDRILAGLQPLLLRRQDDVALLKDTIAAIAADVKALREE